VRLHEIGWSVSTEGARGPVTLSEDSLHSVCHPAAAACGRFPLKLTRSEQSQS
jgi:hypothetical protein